MEKYIEKTNLLDYTSPNIQSLLSKRKWHSLSEVDRLKAIYNFVRDEILFGYNIADAISASAILSDGYGQCNTKSTLLMALLRAVDIPCRIHGFTIDKQLQEGAISGIWYKLAPKNILHSWVEVFINNEWYNLEGVILDKAYLNSLQKINSDCTTTFCGFGVYTDTFQKPQIDFDMNNTYIQEKGINQDFGIFDSPDEFYTLHHQKLNFIKQFIFTHIAREKINANVRKIRNLNMSVN